MLLLLLWGESLQDGNRVPPIRQAASSGLWHPYEANPLWAASLWWGYGLCAKREEARKAFIIGYKRRRLREVAAGAKMWDSCGRFCAPQPPPPSFGCTQSLTAAVRSGHLSPKLTVFLPPSMSSWPHSNPTPALWWWTAQTFAGRVWSALIVHLSPRPRTLHRRPQGSHTFSFLLLKAWKDPKEADDSIAVWHIVHLIMREGSGTEF